MSNYFIVEKQAGEHKVWLVINKLTDDHTTCSTYNEAATLKQYLDLRV